MEEKNDQERNSGEIPRLEWIAGTLGAVIVSAAIAFLIYEGVAGDQSPPDITVEIKDVAAVRDGYRVRFEATNQGGEAAAQVVIEGVIAKGEEDLETSETTLGYVPARSERGGGLFFSKDPRSAELRVRARGYEDP
jgi:uncharacterized protein (TIGR02588 family)